MQSNSQMTRAGGEYSKTTKQYWVRNTSPASLFAWPAWLCLLGLLLLLVWGLLVTSPHIERQVQQRVSEQLTNQNEYLQLENVAVSASGQSVDVSANGQQSVASLAESIASATECPTLFGELNCPIHVDVQLKERAVATLGTPAPEPIPVPAVAIIHNFSATLNGENLLIQGEVPSQEIRESVASAVSAVYENVDNQLVITGEPSATSDVWAAQQASQLLGAAQQGTVRWQDGVLSASLLAASENETAIRGAFPVDESDPRFGSLQLQLAEKVNRCDETFAQLLKENTIQFRTGSAVIAKESYELLQSIAGLAVECNMGLDIEGHTDSVGSAEMNKSLSLSRANAVAQVLATFGANSAQLTAFGYGADRPIASNDTANGRSQNRRIEIRVSNINQ